MLKNGDGFKKKIQRSKSTKKVVTIKTQNKNHNKKGDLDIVFQNEN